MSNRPSKNDGKTVRALVHIVFSGVSVIYRYTDLRSAFRACEAISNAMFRRQADKDALGLIKSDVPMEYMHKKDDGEIVTGVDQIITATIRLDHVSFVGVVCPCCGEQIFDKIGPFRESTAHDCYDTDIKSPQKDEPDDPVPPREEGHGYFDGDEWKGKDRG